MSFFIAKLEKSEELIAFWQNQQERSEQALLRVQGQLCMKSSGTFFVNIIFPKLPPIYWLSCVFAILGVFFEWFLFRNSTIFWVLASIFALFYVPFSRAFHIWAFKKGLRRAGYKGTIFIMPLENGIEEVYFK